MEVGTVTAEGQPGNPRPRLFRLEKDRALINRMGFNNGGSEAARRRLEGHRRRPAGRQYVLGVNVGKSKVTPESEAPEDYARSVSALGPFADYLVINVSSPNTPGLRDLQATDKLQPLIAAARRSLEALALPEPPPILIKVAPDLEDDALVAIAELAEEEGIAGLIATNTTISRAGLRTPEAEVQALGRGGLSGAPLRERALSVLRLLHREVGDRLTLIASGGVEDADDAWARIRAGATLVQVYTGFVYGGPTSARDLAVGLATRARGPGRGRERWGERMRNEPISEEEAAALGRALLAKLKGQPLTFEERRLVERQSRPPSESHRRTGGPVVEEEELLLTLPRRDGAEVRLSYRRFRGTSPFLDLRRWERSRGEWRPTRQGLTVRAREMSRFVSAVLAAAGRLDADRGGGREDEREGAE